MPIYPYVCTECGHEFDALQKISEDPLTECPACGKPGLRKRLTAPAFKLKGTGWYETDFKNTGKKSEASGSKDGDGKADSAGAGNDGGDKKEAAKSGGEAKSTSSGGESKSSTAAAKED